MYIYIYIHICVCVCLLICMLFAHVFHVDLKASGYSAGRPKGLMDVGGKPVESEHVLCKSWLAQRLVDVKVCVCV